MNTWNKLAQDIHADNVKAGWWTDLKTGESILETRDRLNLCMLVVTELNEAYVAHAVDGNDDKLPQYKGVGVELADAQIRLLDMIGAELSFHNSSLNIHHEIIGTRLVDQIRLSGYAPVHARAIGYIADAAEHFRKARGHVAIHELGDALNFIEHLGRSLGFDMEELREAKREFNRNRPDHKVENRKAKGGKVF